MQPTEESLLQNSPADDSPGFENTNDVNNDTDNTDSDTKNVNDNSKPTCGISSPKPDHVKSEETGKEKLLRWINKQMKIEMTDGRVLIGVFLCTDRDGNIILGSCSEYLTEACGFSDEPRMLGLVMVPGRHIVSIHHAPNNIECDST